MSRRRRWVLFASAVALLALVLWYGLGRNRYGDAWEGYARIREGMSREEVVALFGVPPGDYSSGHVHICNTGQEESLAAVDRCNSKCVWVFDAGLFEIGLDDNARVKSKAASANMGGPPTVWERMIHALGY